MDIKKAGVGLAWFIGYVLATKYIVKPLATQLNVPVLKDL